MLVTSHYWKLFQNDLFCVEWDVKQQLNQLGDSVAEPVSMDSGAEGPGLNCSRDAVG